jgi:hypothetical protein
MENLNVYAKENYSESDLVAFGNYLLGTFRIESYQATESELPIEERLATVHQEDIDNWKASIKISSTVGIRQDIQNKIDDIKVKSVTLKDKEMKQRKENLTRENDYILLLIDDINELFDSADYLSQEQLDDLIVQSKKLKSRLLKIQTELLFIQ